MHAGITWRTLQGTYAWVPPPESVSYPAWATAWILGFFFKSFPDDSKVQPRFISSDRGISCGRRDLKAGTEDPLLLEASLSSPKSCCPHLPLFPKSTSFKASLMLICTDLLLCSSLILHCEPLKAGSIFLSFPAPHRSWYITGAPWTFVTSDWKGLSLLLLWPK